ncbi:MAG: class I SAM-dependent methyltransferase [Promethearchaeota archaeon]
MREDLKNGKEELFLSLRTNFARNKRCRVCRSRRLYKFLKLGPTPLANSFLKREQLTSKEPFYPLDVYFCPECGLVQLTDVVSPEILFKDYVYLTGMSQTMKQHFYLLAVEVINNFNLSKDDLVIDIGSNDGTLLMGFKQQGIKTLGLEPATNVALVAEQEGIETVNDFFSVEVAKNIIKRKGHAKVIIGTNVFAHIDDLDEVLQAVDNLLTNDGIFIIEVPYLVDLLSKTEFDTMYHEHLSYFSLRPLVALFKRFNMELFDVKRIQVHGGSIRCYVRRSPSTRKSSVYQLLALEEDLKLNSFNTYLDFGARVRNIKLQLTYLLKKLKGKGYRIIGYGAAAKGNTLLNYCKIGTNILDYIVDNTPFKQGLYTPGMHIPVVPPDRVLKDVPDYVLLLAWNYLDEILEKEQKYREFGGEFIVPIPKPRIV